MSAPPAVSPELRAFCDRVLVPALLERFRAERIAEPRIPPAAPVLRPTSVDFGKSELHG